MAMLTWVREYKARMKEATSTLPSVEQYLQQLYVDDNNTIMEELPPGTRMVDGRFQVIEELVEEDKQVPGDRRTGELAKELANTICPYLQMEVTYPSNHPSSWMPILNLEVKMAKDKTIDFRWYKKPMATNYSILNRSAMPASTKRITLVQMGVTMLRNTRKELHHRLRIPLMEQLADTMMVSGYPEDYRRGVIESAVSCYERQVAASERGEVPLYRPRHWNAPARRRKKLLAKMAWYRPADTVLRVPCTPGAALATAVKQVVGEEASRLGLKVLVQEGAGLVLRRSVVTSDLSAGQPCPQGDCPLCLTGDGKGGLRHHRSGAVYRGDCLVCGVTVNNDGPGPGPSPGGPVAQYWGESGDSGYCRTHQHVAAVQRRDKENAFAKHLSIYHQEREGDATAFKFTLEEVHSKPLPRLCSESVRIHNNNCDIPMNSKAEWHQPVVARVVLMRELEELEEPGRGGGSRKRR